MINNKNNHLYNYTKKKPLKGGKGSLWKYSLLTKNYFDTPQENYANQGKYNNKTLIK